ncbi:hypothetical protein AURDEDRAFT_131417, partial [Auricularia subglabra TFB-10046 SS5]
MDAGVHIIKTAIKTMSQNPVDRSQDYHPSDYTEAGAAAAKAPSNDANQAVALAAAHPAPSQQSPTSPGAMHAESVVPDVSGAGKTATAPKAGPSPVLSRPPSAVVSPQDASMPRGPTGHSGPAPSGAPAAQTGRLSAVPVSVRTGGITPAHSRPPSAAPAQSRPASGAMSQSRPASVARSLDMTQAGPQTVRPPSSSVRGRNVEMLNTAAAATVPRPSSARLPPVSTQTRPGSRTQHAALPPLPETLPVSAAPSIPAAVWGDLAAHAKQWRKAIRVTLLSEGQLRRAYDLVDHLEEASNAQDVAIAQQQLSQLLPGVDTSLILPGQMNAPPRPQSHPLPPPPCDYPSPASGHFLSEVEQPRPMQHGPGTHASWLQSPSALFHSQDDPQQQLLLLPAQTDGPDPHMRLRHPAQVQSTFPGSSLQPEPVSAPPPSFSGGHGQYGQFTAAAQPSLNAHPAHRQQPFSHLPGPPIFGSSWQHGQHGVFGHQTYNAAHPYNTPEGYTGAYAYSAAHTAAHAQHPQTGAPAQYRLAVPPLPSASGPPNGSGAFSGYRGDDRDSFHFPDEDESLQPAERNGAQWPIQPAASLQNAAPAAAALDAARSSPAAAAAAFATHAPPAAAVTATTHAPPAAAVTATTHAPPAAAAASTSASRAPVGTQAAVPSTAAATSPTSAQTSMPPVAPAAPPAPPAAARSVAAPTKNGGVKLRGNAATVRSDNPEEDALKQPLRLPFPKTPHGRFKSRRKRKEEVVERLSSVFQRVRTEIFALAEELGENPLELLREAMMGTGFGKESPWNLFEQFHSMRRGEWDVRDSYDFGEKTTHEAWSDFKADADYESVLMRFAWTFPEPSAIKTLGKMDKFFLTIRDHFHEAVSILMAGQNSESDSGLVSIDMAPNAKHYFDMFGMPIDVVGRTYQNNVQHTADMIEVAGMVGKPVPRMALDLELPPKLTDPVRYDGWDLARIYNDNTIPLYEAASPHIAPIPKRATECQFLAHLLVNMKNELCIDNWPWWLPLPYSPTLNVDRGLQCYGLRETQYLIQWLCMRDPDDPTRPHPLGPRLCFAGERTDPETPLPTIRTTPVNYPGSDWHGRVLTYSLGNHTLVTPMALELRMWRQLTGEIDSVYRFKHHGKDPRDKTVEDVTASGPSVPTVPATRSNGRRRNVSSAVVTNEMDASGDDEAAMNVDESEQPAAAAARRTRSRVAAALPPLPLDENPAQEPPLMYDGHMPTDGPDGAYWLPSSGNAVQGFPGGVPDNFSVWTCAYARNQPGKWTSYKVRLTKARKKTVQRIGLRQPAPPQLPINGGGAVRAEEGEEIDDDDDEPQASSSVLTNKRARLESAEEGRGRGVAATPSKRKAPAAAAASTPKSASAAAAATSTRTPIRTSAAAAAASTSTPSRATSAAVGGTPQAARTPGRQLTIDIPKSRGNTPAPPPAEKQFRASMLDKPEGPVPEWLPRVPAALEPASVQTAYYRVGVAMKRRRALPEEFCLVLEDLLDAWPVTEALPDDLWQ